jgi:hypothetical protein
VDKLKDSMVRQDSKRGITTKQAQPAAVPLPSAQRPNPRANSQVNRRGVIKHNKKDAYKRPQFIQAEGFLGHGTAQVVASHDDPKNTFLAKGLSHSSDGINFGTPADRLSDLEQLPVLRWPEHLAGLPPLTYDDLVAGNWTETNSGSLKRGQTPPWDQQNASSEWTSELPPLPNFNPSTEGAATKGARLADQHLGLPPIPKNFGMQTPRVSAPLRTGSKSGENPTQKRNVAESRNGHSAEHVQRPAIAPFTLEAYEHLIGTLRTYHVEDAVRLVNRAQDPVARTVLMAAFRRAFTTNAPN